MSGNERKNYVKITRWTENDRRERSASVSGPGVGGRAALPRPLFIRARTKKPCSFFFLLILMINKRIDDDDVRN